MKTILLILTALALAACASTQPLTPEQTVAGAHTVIGNSLADYKAAQPILHR